MKHSVNYIFRAPEAGFHSIEGVFSNVGGMLREEYDVRNEYMPMRGASLQSMARNYAAARRIRGDINHVTGHVNYIVPALQNYTVLTVHDVYSSFAGRFLRDKIIRFLWFRWPARRANKLTAVSEFSANELCRIVPGAASKIHVVHDPYDPSFNYAESNFNAAQPRILHIGTKPNKNLHRTIAALEGLQCQLVIVGHVTDQDRFVLDRAGVSYEAHESLSRREIVEQYEKCDLVCFASLYEGFGMPVIEANVVGRPVVAGNIAAIPEVAGDAACLVDPYDPADIRSGIDRVIQDHEYRRELVSKGVRNAERFNPRKIARDYAEMYCSALIREKRPGARLRRKIRAKD